MRRAAGADRSERDWIVIRLHPGHQLGRGLRRQSVFADDPQRRARQQRDRLQVVQDVVIERIERRRADMAGPVADADGIAIRSRVNDASGRDGAAGAADGFDDDRLAERAPHRIGEDPPQRIGRAAGRKADQHGDGVRRIIVGQRDDRTDRKRNERDKHANETGSHHGISPLAFPDFLCVISSESASPFGITLYATMTRQVVA